MNVSYWVWANEWMDENEWVNDLMIGRTDSQMDYSDGSMHCCFRGERRSCVHWWTNAFRRSTQTPRWGSLTKTSRRELVHSVHWDKPVLTTLTLVSNLPLLFLADFDRRTSLSSLRVVSIADCPPNSAVNRRRPGFSGCCLSCLERSATAHHGCRISACLLQSPQDSSL